MIEEKRYPAKKAAEILGVRYQTIRTWMCRHQVEYTKIRNRCFFSQSQIEELINVIPAEPQAGSGSQ
jgi:predicted site-specific integrase-resolvase